MSDDLQTIKNNNLESLAASTYFAAEQEFEAKCRRANTAHDVCNIVDIFAQTLQNNHDDGATHFDSLSYAAKPIYNKYIGWALPTCQVCNLIFSFWNKRQTSKIVDMGAGSGFCCLLLEAVGVSANKLLAVECQYPPQGWATKHCFWPILRDDDFAVDIDDIFFVAWGTGGVMEKLCDYVRRGGRYVIILGETDGGCALSCDFFARHDEWNVDRIHVQGPASDVAEHLTFNIRKR